MELRECQNQKDYGCFMVTYNDSKYYVHVVATTSEKSKFPYKASISKVNDDSKWDRIATATPSSFHCSDHKLYAILMSKVCHHLKTQQEITDSIEEQQLLEQTLFDLDV